MKRKTRNKSSPEPDKHERVVTPEDEFELIKKSIESVSTGITIADVSGRIIYTNPAEAKMHGYKIRELIGKDIYIFSCGQMRGNSKSEKTARWQEWTREVTNVRKNGTTFPVQLKSIPIHDPEGNPSHIITISEDITERKKVEEALRIAYDKLEERVEQRTKELVRANKRLERELIERRKVESRLRLLGKLFENTSEAVVVADERARIVEVNKAYTSITGYGRKEVIGKRPNFLKPNNTDDGIYSEIWNTVNLGDSWQGEAFVRKKNGEICPLWLSVSPVLDGSGKVTHHVGISIDISVIKKTEERLQHLANYDPLTNLPNRVLFNDRLILAIAIAHRHKSMAALIVIDLDRFKEVNDTLGHPIGDQLIIAVSKRLKQTIRETDTLSRLGGDEFAVILTDVESVDGAARAAQQFINNLSEPFMLEGHEIYITASIGIALYPGDSIDKDTLFKSADAAMYSAKIKGKNNFQFFTAQMNDLIIEKLLIESKLRRALDKEEFFLCFQPQVNAKNGRIEVIEALIRWVNPDLGEISPKRFIPVAEDTGLITTIGEWVLREACKINKAWQEEGLPRMTVAVNLSARQFHKQDLAKIISAILTDTKLDPELLELEITESAIMQDVDDTIETLRRLKSIGVRLSVDDFGTGYSSLNYLRQFPIDVLKIDQSFVRDIKSETNGNSIVSAIIAFAHSMGLEVVAEGVETKEQLDFLRLKGCDRLQGYYYMKPLRNTEMRKRLKNIMKHPIQE